MGAPLGGDPVVDGPVELPLKKFTLVRFFAEACGTGHEIKALLTVALPNSLSEQDFDGLMAGAKPDRVGCQWIPGGFKIGFENHLLVDWRHLKEQLGAKFKRFLEQLPDGTTLTLAFAAENEPATKQFYRGKIFECNWQIAETSPVVPANVLADALKLAADAPKTSHALNDPVEADAVMEAVSKDSYLHSMGVECDGNTVSCQYDVEFLAKIIFRLRFRDYWNVLPYESWAEQEYQERIKIEWGMRRQLAERARQNHPPRIGAPIYRGNASIYWKSDLLHFKDLKPDVLTQFEAGMQSLGFRMLGDFVAKRFREYVLRVFVSPDKLSYASLTASNFGYLCYEFISEFSDGSRLTTTTTSMAFSRPGVKLFYKDYPGLEVEPLFAQHLTLFTRFEQHKNAVPVALEPTLEGVARYFDQTLERTDQDEAIHGEDDLEELG